MTSIFLLYSFSTQANEDKRAALLEVINQQINIHTNMGNNSQVNNLQSAKNRVLQLSFEELAVLPESSAFNRLKTANNILETQTLSVATSKILGNFANKASTTLTQPDYADFPLCGTAPGERYSDTAVFVSEQALFVAEVVREVASRGCEQVAVAAGFGGNTSAVCIATDAVYIAAKEAHNILSFCDAEVDEAQLETTFLRTEDLFNLGHEISDELSAHDSAVSGLINSHDSDMKLALSNHDSDIKSDIAIHDVSIKSALQQHDQDIKNILGQVLANQGQMLANQEEIIQLLKTPSGRRPGWNKP